MGLKTPEKIRNLQRKLYLMAKSEPAFRFYIVYDKIYREDILEHAHRMAKANGGSAGVDGVTFEMVESEGVEEWLAGIRKQLHAKTCKPQPVRRVMIPKPGGGDRPLGIPKVDAPSKFGLSGVDLADFHFTMFLNIYESTSRRMIGK